MSTRSISTLQTGQLLDATHGLVLAYKSSNGVKIINLDGYVSGAAAQYWLQFHNITTFPTDSTKLVKSVQVVGSNGFTFAYGSPGLDASGLTLPPNDGSLILVVSSTEHTFTAVAGNVSVDVAIEEYELAGVSQTFVGNLTTNVDGRVGAQNKIYRIEGKNNSAGTRYFMLFDQSGASNGDIPLAQSLAIAAGQTFMIDFGTSGRVLTNGWSVIASTTNGTLTKDSGFLFYIQVTV